MCGDRRHLSRRDMTSEPRDRSVRASDADRDRAAEMLRDESAAGRLTPEELDERLERAFAATTLADLDELGRDLPQRDERGPAPARAGFHPMRGGLLVLIVALAAISVAVGHPVIWLALPLLFLVRARWMFAPRWR